MVTNPLAQRRAQAEIDAVVGRSRPPSFKDFDSLVYVRAMVKEVSIIPLFTMSPSLNVFLRALD